MNLKSVSGVSYRVRDLDATVNFYLSLGFREGKKDDSSTSIYLNWFWLEFYNVEKASSDEGLSLEDKTDSMQEVLLYMSVADLAETVRELEERGLNPTPEILNKRKGRRETSISDPDGYRLVFFQKK